MAADDLYAQLLDELYRVNQSRDPAARRSAFALLNTVLSPHLTDETAFFQLLLYRFGHLWLQPEQPVRLHIAPGARHWAADCRITQLTYAADVGGFSFVLEPSNPSAAQASALCFPGTGPVYKRDVLVAGVVPRGVRDDMHWDGVGMGGARHHMATWVAQVQAQRQLGRSVLLVGHSLGAVYAAELFAEVHAQLPSPLASDVALLLFTPPGLRRSTLMALRPQRQWVRMVEHTWDAVRLFGHGTPAAQVHRRHELTGASLARLQVPHAVPQLALLQLRGALSAVPWTERDMQLHRWRLPLEWLRQRVGRALQRWLTV